MLSSLQKSCLFYKFNEIHAFKEVAATEVVLCYVPVPLSWLQIAYSQSPHPQAVAVSAAPHQAKLISKQEELQQSCHLLWAKYAERGEPAPTGGAGGGKRQDMLNLPTSYTSLRQSEHSC